MAARSRSRVSYSIGGTAETTQPGLSNQIQSNLATTATMSDVTGNRNGDNPMSSDSGVPVMGYVTAGSKTQYYQTTKDWYYGLPNFTGSIPGMISNSVAINKAQNITNPSRPYIDFAMLVQDFYDLPRMVKGLGDFIISGKMPKVRNKPLRNLAGDYLNYKFGWVPLIDDLNKLLNFESAVEKRKKQLRTLRDRGLRRHYTAFDATQVYPSSKVYPQSFYGGSNWLTYDLHVHQKKWVSLRYRPTSATPPLDETGLDVYARNLMWGRSLSFATIWELMPWTWLFDWFSDLGDIISSSRNTLATQVTNINVMTQTTISAENFAHGTVYQPWTFAPTGEKRIKKVRALGSPTPFPSLYLPFLDGGQLSILSALFVSKNVRL